MSQSLDRMGYGTTRYRSFAPECARGNEGHGGCSSPLLVQRAHTGWVYPVAKTNRAGSVSNKFCLAVLACGKGRVPGNRLQSNRWVGWVKRIAQGWAGENVHARLD